MIFAGTRSLGSVVLGVCAEFAAVVPPALAEDKGPVTVQVWTIRATKSNDKISKKLQPMAKALEKDFRFTGYQLTGTDSRKMSINQGREFKLLGPYNMTIKPQKRRYAHSTLKIVVTAKKGKKKVPKLNSTVRLKPGKFQLMGGWKLGGGDVLIVAVSAK